jgi:hypothetical protein
MGRLIKTGLITFFLSLVVAYLVIVTALIVGGEIAGVSQREGAYAMGAIFLMGPFFAVVAATAVTIVATLRTRRRMAAETKPTSASD